MKNQSFPPSVVSSSLSITIETPSALVIHSKSEWKEVKAFIDQNGFDLSRDRLTATYTMAHRTIPGIKFTSFTEADVLDYACNHCYPSFREPLPPFQNIVSPDLTLIRGKYQDYTFPEGSLVISDPPYGISYPNYDEWVDDEDDDTWYANVSPIKGKKAVLVLPLHRTCQLIKEWGEPSFMIPWVYNSNQHKQTRYVTWWGCKPNLSARGLGQKCKNPNDKRLGEEVINGLVRLYDWWYIDIVKGNSAQKNHPCPVPEELIRRIILSTATEGQHICDPFNGGGTTGVVARQYGHPFTGFDVSNRYCHDAAKRIAKVVPAVKQPVVTHIAALQKAA